MQHYAAEQRVFRKYVRKSLYRSSNGDLITTFQISRLRE